MANFIPRLHFPTLASLPRTYYLGHHAAALSKMRTLLGQTDLVLECRDARIPLTSRNPVFEEALRGRARVVVFTKGDLAGGEGEEGRRGAEKRQALLRALHHPSPVLFSDHTNRRDVQSILTHIREAAERRGNLTGSHLLVVGMPNVGKSSLLNALRREGTGRKGKAAQTGGQPGVTRKIGTGVKIIDPEEGSGGSGGVYLLDTPGVFMPYVPDGEAMLKLALCGCVKDPVIPAFTLVDYLLFLLNLRGESGGPEVYGEFCRPTNDVQEFLVGVAERTGRVKSWGEWDLEGSAGWILRRWRGGGLGRGVLDSVEEGVVESLRRGEGLEGPRSQSRMVREGKEVLRERARARRRAG